VFLPHIKDHFRLLSPFFSSVVVHVGLPVRLTHGCGLVPRPFADDEDTQRASLRPCPCGMRLLCLGSEAKDYTVCTVHLQKLSIDE
jgi:hypothetical protein